MPRQCLVTHGTYVIPLHLSTAPRPEVALGGGEDRRSVGSAPMKAGTAEDFPCENARRQRVAIDRDEGTCRAPALPVRRRPPRRRVGAFNRLGDTLSVSGYRRRAVQDRLCAVPIGRASPCIRAARPAPSARRAGLASKISSSSRSHWPGGCGRWIACEQPWSLASQGALSISI